MRALVVERDPMNVIGKVRALQLATITVDTAKSGEDAVDMTRHFDYDVMILGVSLADMTGVEALRRLRARNISVPAIATTKSGDLAAVVQALDIGADDCITPATDRTEFLARVRSVIRRSKGFARSALTAANLTLDIQSKDVTIESRAVNLTGKEQSIMELLIMRKGVVQSKEAILTHLYNGIDEPEMKIIDVFICKLRRKLAEAGFSGAIGTVWGRGYVLREIAEAPATAPRTIVATAPDVARAA
ncbi:response regulator transcription factor [Plastoroseomonas hellenica]|uniref:response regulator transcription factor n=1 Tax=Plastoroseomonas hellenica TaxID=2687306 RepID=UPI001BA84C47|nr:response regulator transcription factor [Plastoroseomonas hellenica]MBR0641351.1 response regulator transcription factor [Plastoroseomonas hellenica]